MKKVAFLIFVLWGLSSHVHASLFSGECISTILEESAYQVVIRQFCEQTKEKMLTLTLPTTGKRLPSPAFLHFEKTEVQPETEEKTWVRKTYLNICAPTQTPLEDQEGNLFFFGDRIDTQKVGTIVLHESPKNKNPDGPFSLHFIEVNEGHKGKKYGSSALDLSIMLAQNLSKRSTFYNLLRLQCSDYDGDRHLGNVPYRLAYYLNHGFELDPRTQGLLKHLDVDYFVYTLDEEQLDNYLGHYLSDFYEGKENYNLRRVLKALKKHYKTSKINTLDHLKQLAESNSSLAAIRILNRAYYDPTMDDSLQNISGELTYAMLLDVNQWESAVLVRQALKTNRKEAAQYSYDLEEDKKFHEVLIDYLDDFKVKAKSEKKKRKKVAKKKKEKKKKRPLGRENTNPKGMKRDLKRSKKKEEEVVRTSSLNQLVPTSGNEVF